MNFPTFLQIFHFLIIFKNSRQSFNDQNCCELEHKMSEDINKASTSQIKSCLCSHSSVFNIKNKIEKTQEDQDKENSVLIEIAYFCNTYKSYINTIRYLNHGKIRNLIDNGKIVLNDLKILKISINSYFKNFNLSEDQQSEDYENFFNLLEMYVYNIHADILTISNMNSKEEVQNYFGKMYKNVDHEFTKFSNEILKYLIQRNLQFYKIQEIEELNEITSFHVLSYFIERFPSIIPQFNYSNETKQIKKSFIMFKELCDPYIDFKDSNIQCKTFESPPKNGCVILQFFDDSFRDNFTSLIDSNKDVCLNFIITMFRNLILLLNEKKSCNQKYNDANYQKQLKKPINSFQEITSEKLHRIYRKKHKNTMKKLQKQQENIISHLKAICHRLSASLDKVYTSSEQIINEKNHQLYFFDILCTKLKRNIISIQSIESFYLESTNQLDQPNQELLFFLLDFYILKLKWCYLYIYNVYNKKDASNIFDEFKLVYDLWGHFIDLYYHNSFNLLSKYFNENCRILTQQKKLIALLLKSVKRLDYSLINFYSTSKIPDDKEQNTICRIMKRTLKWSANIDCVIRKQKAVQNTFKVFKNVFERFLESQLSLYNSNMIEANIIAKNLHAKKVLALYHKYFQDQLITLSKMRINDNEKLIDQYYIAELAFEFINVIFNSHISDLNNIPRWENILSAFGDFNNIFKCYVSLLYRLCIHC
ncbi:hypothetical protein EDEG_02478 [Edhazardia aedis USNM 41457]|uniref:Uncharacterized protein n=1 Tax=Edhazardia aedis (strain USNM 41457) TaxID=1003232 RepID=J8ZU40_EDHAE|nr:hypothetical protein EDEG_02478 [Edhazardia aedis USNM 41457]|eukprot:EJW03173.1 hypothetical protein EDEG_02478 [Edhazardia aedis USNM 41457]